MALLATGIPNGLALGAVDGDSILLVEAASIPGGFSKLNDGVDGCFKAVEKNGDGFVLVAGCFSEVDWLPKFENVLRVGLVSTGLLLDESWGCFKVLNRTACGFD